MKQPNFDREINTPNSMGLTDLGVAMLIVADHINFADALAEDLFGDKKTPASVIEIYRLFLEQYEVGKRFPYED